MNPESVGNREVDGLISEMNLENANLGKEWARVLEGLKTVCDNIFMNLDECFDLLQITERSFVCQNYVNQWVLSEFFLLDNKDLANEESMKIFIEEKICSCYWGLVQAQVYNRNSKDREECFLVALYIFSKIFECVKKHTNANLMQDSIIDGMIFSKIHRKVEKRWNEICNEIMILESIMRANFVIKAVSNIKNGFMKLSIDGELPVSLIKNATVYINASHAPHVLNDIRRLCGVKYVDFLTDESVYAQNMFEENMLVEYAILFDDADIIDEELEKLDKMREHIQLEIQRVSFLLNNSIFVEKAPSDKIEEEERKYEFYSARLEELDRIECYLNKFSTQEISI